MTCCKNQIRRSLVLAMLVGMTSTVGAVSAETPDFDRDVRPILVRHCVACHGEKKAESKLDLRQRDSLTRGGQSGPAVMGGSAEQSLIIERIVEGSMPPDDRPRLDRNEIQTLRAWIDALPAAKAGPTSSSAAIRPEDANYWAFQKLKRPETPAVRHAQQVRTPIDAFILAKLEERGLSFSPEAERLTLLRRAHFDLIGLPPSPEEIKDFLSQFPAERSESSSSDREAEDAAYERLIDKLLASPHYGERWGRHWLDAAGYADTIKTDNDFNGGAVREGMWRYRDYVVRSLNADKPYDQFVREQLAGDELTGVRDLAKYPAESITPQMQEYLAATGMLRTSPDGTNNFERNRPLERHEVLYDTIENLTSNLLGLTVACARCHDHKFDPITQRDYYGLMACLTPSYNPAAWIQPQKRHLVISTAAELAANEKFNKELNRLAGEIGGRAAKIRRPYEQRLYDARLAALPQAVREDLAAAQKIESSKRTEVQKYLAEKFANALRPSREEVAQAMTTEERTEADALDRQVEDIRARQRKEQRIQALFEIGEPPVTRLLRRGNYETPGPEVVPAIPRILADEAGELATNAPSPGGTSGRRLALADALTAQNSRSSGLLARVIVNRLWQHHFGRGIVPTSGNFGRSGEPPTHPELLEWLAADFIDGGWKLKRLHKLMLMSGTYRQASSVSAVSGNDPDNVLLGRMRLRRLESEVIRDSILAVSGRLDASLGGPPIMLEGRPDGTVVATARGFDDPNAVRRRSLYLLARRNFNLSLLSVFDQPLMGTNCTVRNQSAVVSQSLTMLNDSFVIEESNYFAERVRAVAGPKSQMQVQTAFLIALGRDPTDDERRLSLQFLMSQSAGEGGSLPLFCQMLLNTNEFLYIE
jgi:hypothetical protein